MEAITREEKIISGENLTPITREEMFLAKAAGQDVETPTPITRREMFLSKIVGGGAGSGGCDIIDVTELPTENIEDSKIYRVTKEAETELFLAMTNSTGEHLMESMEAVMTEMMSAPVTLTVHIVDALPDSMERPVQSADGNHMTVYVLESTGVPYVSMSGDPADAMPFNSMLGALSGAEGGIIDSVDEVVYPESNGTTLYVLRGSSSTTYGIPDEANNKTVFKHNGSEWVECGKGSV